LSIRTFSKYVYYSKILMPSFKGVTPVNTATPKSPTTERTWLAVSYAEKEAARAAGALWDKEAKVWFAPAGLDLKPLTAWLPRQEMLDAALRKQSLQNLNPAAEFGVAIRAAGLVMEGEPIMDGQLHRVPVEGAKAGKDGAYVGHADARPSGFIQNHRTGVKDTWAAEVSHLTDEEQAHLAAHTQMAKQRRATGVSEQYAQAAAKALARWEQLAEVPNTMPTNAYLLRKEVQAHGVKFDGDLLVVPVRDVDGKLWSLQTIGPEVGAPKLFQKGGRKAGHMHVIGELSAETPILVAEGYATAASLHEATGLPVVVAFDAGNLDAVVGAIKQRFATHAIYIMGDNDQHAQTNVGVEKALAAAQKHNVGVAFPEFEAPDKLSDFNDLHVLAGLAAVKAQVEKALSVSMQQSLEPIQPAETAATPEPTAPVESLKVALEVPLKVDEPMHSGDDTPPESLPTDAQPATEMPLLLDEGAPDEEDVWPPLAQAIEAQLMQRLQAKSTADTDKAHSAMGINDTPTLSAAAPIEGTPATVSTEDSAACGFHRGTAPGDRPTPYQPTPSELIGKLLEGMSYETQKNGSVVYLLHQKPIFTDHGNQILMHSAANDDDQAILAAVLLAKEKWGGEIELTGTDDFKRRALEVMLKNNVEVRLKNPQQEVMLREMQQATAATTVAAELPTAPSASTAPLQSLKDKALADNLPTTVTPMRALDWWSVQKQLIEHSASPAEKNAGLAQLGPAPRADHVFWFDATGRRSDAPTDAAARLHTLHARVEKPTNATPTLVLRGVKKVGDRYETTALLVQGVGDYMQGFIVVEGRKRQVIAHMTPRPPDAQTGELHPDFLRISELQGDAQNACWREIGYGNAVNHRTDGKPVHFDEVLLRVGKELVKVRDVGQVDSPWHQKLGFFEAKKPRSSPQSPAHSPEAFAEKVQVKLAPKTTLVAKAQGHVSTPPAPKPAPPTGLDDLPVATPTPQPASKRRAKQKVAA
jgi:phage/plasmid primase-like uncharacterized protein